MQFFSDAEMIRTYRDTLKVEFPLISEAGANKKLWDVVVGHFPGAMPRLGLVRPSDKEIVINTRSTTELEAKMTEVIGNTGIEPMEGSFQKKSIPVIVTGGLHSIIIDLSAAGEFGIDVYTSNGRKVFGCKNRFYSPGRTSIPVFGLGEGVYMVVVTSPKNSHVSKCMIK
jgi:hypothetical protein